MDNYDWCMIKQRFYDEIYDEDVALDELIEIVVGSYVRELFEKAINSSNN